MDDLNDLDDALERTDNNLSPSSDTHGLQLDEQFVSQVTSLVSEEPRTVREVHQSLGSSQGLSRDQTEYRLDKLSDLGQIRSKKSPGRTAPKIFWQDCSSSNSSGSPIQRKDEDG